MQKLVLLTVLSLTTALSYGQTEKALQISDAEVQAEMQEYMKSLDLTPEQQYYVIEILGDKREKKKEALAEIIRQKRIIRDIDLATEKRILDLLTDEQKAIFHAELKTAIEQRSQESLDEVDTD